MIALLELLSGWLPRDRSVQGVLERPGVAEKDGIPHAEGISWWHHQEVSAPPVSRQDVNHWTERSFGDLVGH